MTCATRHSRPSHMLQACLDQSPLCTPPRTLTSLLCVVRGRLLLVKTGPSDNTILMPNNHSVTVEDQQNGTYLVLVAIMMPATVKLIVNMDKDLPGTTGELPPIQLTFAKATEKPSTEELTPTAVVDVTEKVAPAPVDKAALTPDKTAPTASDIKGPELPTDKISPALSRASSRGPANGSMRGPSPPNEPLPSGAPKTVTEERTDPIIADQMNGAAS